MRVIHTQGLTRRFGENVAVADLDLTVRQGEVFGFLGHNGAGKTTTVRLLNGVLAADSGTISVLGLDPATDGPALRARTGVLTETPSLDERLSAQENLRIYARLYGLEKSQINARVSEMLAAFDLSDRAADKVGGFSKGMKQRLALARAFLHRPELLFLDEPTSGLDPISQRQVHEMIQQISRDEGHTVFICTHNLEEAQRLCHRVAVMEHGRLMAIGTPAELAAQTGGGLRYQVTVAPGSATAAKYALNDVYGSAIVAEGDEDGLTTLTLKLPDRETVPDMLSLLVGEGVRVYQVTPQAASLEDIYFALHGKSTQRVQEVAR